MKDIKEKIPSDIPYEKITQEQIFRNAIDAARKKRATKPSEYPNDVWALKSILLPKERKVVEEYLTDSKPYTEELNQLEQELKTVTDVTLQNRIRLYRKRDLSFYLYQEEIKRQYKDGTLEDMNFDNAIDKNDIVIKLYEGLFEKIVDALVDGGWISTGKRRTLGSGGTLGEENLGIIYEDNR